MLTARGMAERGHRVWLACREGGALEQRARAAGLEVLPLPLGGDLSPRAALRLRAHGHRFGFEVAQLHDPHALSAGALAFLGLQAAPALVATRRVDFALRGRLSRLKYRRCARVIAVSRAIAGVLELDGLDPERIRVVHEGVADRAAGAGALKALAELGVPRGALVVGNVAALVDHKDHVTLLAAAARVVAREPRVHFVLLGEGELRPQLERQVESLGIGERVHLAGFRDDVDRLLPGFDVFCLSSHMEGLGTSILDAMCFGRAIVATSAGGIPDAVEDGVSGCLVPPRDPEGLAGALLRLLAHPEQARRLGAGARARYETAFSADRMVERTLAVLEEAVADRARRGPRAQAASSS
jgi:glycosyltransferase involved in cell wall biosynthesis